MIAKIFNKHILTFLVLLLLLATGVRFYEVSMTPKVSGWNYHQLQKIDKSKSNFSFAVFGDNRNSIQTFNHLITQVNQEKPLFSVDIGDLVFDSEKPKWRFFIRQIMSFNQPFLTVYGNHEAWDEDKDFYTSTFGPTYYSFIVGESYFIVLDDSNEKNLDDAQFAWLKNELKISQKYQNRFVFMHVPLYDPQGNNVILTVHGLENVEFAKKLNQLFDENNVTMLFCSHIHGYFSGKFGKTPYIVTGGAGAPLKGTNPKHYFYHYIKVNINDKDVTYDVVKIKTWTPKSLVGRGFYDIFILYGYYYLRV